MPKQETIDIGEFPLHEMDPNVKIVAIGTSGSGKSKCIEDIVAVHAHQFPVAVAISGSEDNNHAYAKMFPDINIFTEYDEEILQNIETRQKKIMQDAERDPSINPWLLLIIDDCSHDQKYMKRPLFQKFYKMGRHWKIMIILAIQYCGDIPPVIRSNIDHAIIYREPNVSNRKKIYENYAGIIGDFATFCDLMDQITGEFTAMVISNRNQTNDLQKCVHSYKARLHDNIKFGCQESKQWSEARYNPKYMLEN